MHYEFEHSDIIEEYEQLISYKKVVGSELNKRGRNEIIYEDNDIYIAYFQVSPMELNESNGFQSGDLKVFCRTNQKNVLSENDIIPALRTIFISVLLFISSHIIVSICPLIFVLSSFIIYHSTS